MNASDRRDERGSALPLVLVAALALFAVLAFSVDQGIAYAAKARQENALDAARAACMDASFALVAKNADDPGRMVADRVVRTARDAGFEGKASVWFYETPEESVSSTERHWVVGMQFEEESPTVFARGYGIEGLPVALVPGADGDALCRGKGVAAGNEALRTIRLPGGSDCGLMDVRGAELARRLSGGACRSGAGDVGREREIGRFDPAETRERNRLW